MSGKGWIKLHRKMLHNPIFQDPYLFKLWMYCLLKASHSEHKQLVGSKVVELESGQFVWGRKEATEDLNKGAKTKERRSESTWERHLKTLENLEMLNRETNNEFTLVTVDKWAFYQHETNQFEQQNEQQMNSTCTASEQQVNTNKNVKNLRIKELSSSSGSNMRENPFDVYEQNFGLLSPILRDSLIDWCEDLTDEIVIYGMRLAAKQGGRSFKYMESIWKEWHKAGLKTIEEVRTYEEQKSLAKSNTVPFRQKASGSSRYSNTW